MASLLRKLVCASLIVTGRIPVLGRPYLEFARACAGTWKDRRFLGGLTPWPWISPRAQFAFDGQATFGRDVFIDDGCVIYGRDASCRLVLGPHVSIYRNTLIQFGNGGSVEIGEDTHIQNDCLITAYGPVRIGRHVQFAPRCALYPYDHGMDDVATPIKDQPLRHRGGIVIEDDVWLGVGVIVLDGVTVGRGAVIGAGAVVNRSVPPLAIAAGVPAKVVGHRGGPEKAGGG